MHSSFPTRPDNRSWLGAPCDQFCQQFGADHDTPSHTCILTTCLESKRPASALLEQPSGKRYHLAATPITNLEGQVQEVLHDSIAACHEGHRHCQRHFVVVVRPTAVEVELGR